MCTPSTSSQLRVRSDSESSEMEQESSTISPLQRLITQSAKRKNITESDVHTHTPSLQKKHQKMDKWLRKCSSSDSSLEDTSSSSEESVQSVETESWEEDEGQDVRSQVGDVGDISKLFSSTTELISAMPETILLEYLKNPDANVRALWEQTNGSLDPSRSYEDGNKGAKGYAYYKVCFENTLEDNCIINNDHYEHILKTNSQLRRFEKKMRPNELESLKKTIFRSNYLKASKNIIVRLCDYNYVENGEVWDEENLQKLGMCKKFLNYIAGNNGICVEQMCKELRDILEGNAGKKKGIILCGAADAGKSMLMRLLVHGLYQPWEIGTFMCPVTKQPSTFMFECLTSTHIYVCEEMIFENIDVIQQYKQLMEGAETMRSDVKHKTSVRLEPNTVIVCMNSRSKKGILDWHPSEYPTFEARNLILYFPDTNFTGLLNKAEKSLFFKDNDIRRIMLNCINDFANAIIIDDVDTGFSRDWTKD